MSDQIAENTNPSPDVGQTSMESRRQRKKIERSGIMEGFNIYTAMLLLSFACVLTSLFLLFFEIRNWGAFPGSPWSTDSVKIEIRGN